ncbi:glycosyltransferase 28 domain protein [Nocardioides sp. CF8]|uniref:glycosyltransferase n=1 Tax=Nocardioides sp. CF8 TaxID=110319 RepID=UPI00032EC6D0|nr:glycosyltransferase [Nocardioides sp. CF8]EON22948.1 glycosyltransferase 28 domain protein [Nocardioides sp. CF8]
MTTLLVANDGGHIMQLHTLRRRLDIGDDLLWMTPRTPQTESLLAGERVRWTRPCPTRDLGALVRNTWEARDVFSRHDLSLVVSTGAALALAVLPQARLHGVRCVYIESATRVSGPSLSGALLSRFPGIRTFSQSTALTSRGWRFLASPWDVYETRKDREVPQLCSVVVSLGTSPYDFRLLVEHLISIIPPTAHVLWQTGVTDVSGLGIEARAKVAAAELRAAIERADVVIAHAGTGAALAALEAGRCPVLVPRRSMRQEHVDDHQLQIALDFALRDLAIVREVAHLKHEDLLLAAARSVVRKADLPRLLIAHDPVRPALAGAVVGRHRTGASGP